MSDTFTIRSASRDDMDAVMAVIRGVYEEYGFIFEPSDETPDLLDFDGHYTLPRGAFFVGVVNGQIVGSAGIDFADTDTAEVHRLYLDASQRGKRRGQELLEQVITWAREHGAKRILLWSDTRFTLAHRLYERRGFVQGPTRQTDDLNHSTEYAYFLTL